MIAQPWLDVGAQLWESRGWLPFSLAWYAKCVWPGEQSLEEDASQQPSSQMLLRNESQFSTQSFPACCVPCRGPREKDDSSAPEGEGNPKNPQSLWSKEPHQNEAQGRRHEGNAGREARPEKFASDLCLASLVELCRRVPTAGMGRISRQRIQLRGHQEVDLLETWTSWLWQPQRLLLWTSFLSERTTKTCEDSNLFSQVLKRQSRSRLKPLFGWQKA